MNEPGKGAGLVVARVLVGLALLVATLWVLRPFLVPGAWAAITAYVTWPVYARARALTKRPALTAGFFTLVLAAIVAIPVGWLLVVLATEATQVAAQLRDWAAQGGPFPEFVTARPWLDSRLQELRENTLFGHAGLGEWIGRYGSDLSSRAVTITGGIARNLLDFLITIVVLFALYLDGERVGTQARRLAVLLMPSNDPGLVDHVGAIVRAVVFGLLGTAIVQGALAGLGFWVLDVPSAVFLGFATVLTALLPGGPAIIWGATCVWLYFEGRVGATIALALYGALIVSTVDNFLRPLLISGSTRIPFLLVFLGVLGGLASLGLLGMFVGPVLLAVGFGLLAEFPDRVAPRAAGE
ncbi:MAG: AI-2E family transporter [Deltaproteobacteria bacterium]|nr:AI-2E family transporter [Deltaproteobacteria bacterium]